MSSDGVGEDESLRNNFMYWSDQAHRIAARIIRDQNLAEDLAQSALKRLWGAGEVPHNVPGWLTTTIRNLAIDRHRRDGLRPEVGDEGLKMRAADRTVSSGVVERDYIREVLDGLPEQHREALLLAAAGFTNAEIAESLGFASDRVVAATLSRLRRRLREQRDAPETNSQEAPTNRQSSPIASAATPPNHHPGDRMTPVPPEVAARIRRDPPEDHKVIQGSTPVVFFGSQPSARVATLGINPSTQEFNDHNRVERDGESRRFETLRSLGNLASNSAANDSHVEAIYERCLNYFRDPETGIAPRSTAYWRWFKDLEDIIEPLTGASYLNGTACHLDLVQWATDPIWGDVPPTVQDSLLKEDAEFLKWQLSARQLDILYLNGGAVCSQFLQVVPEAPLRSERLESPGGRGAVFYRGWFRGTRIVGTTYNIQNPWNPGSRAAAKAWIVEECRRMLRMNEDERDN